MRNKSNRHPIFRKVPKHRRGASAVLAFAVAALTPAAGYAWTSVGEYRNFPATLIVPQVTSTDGFWFTPSTQPFDGMKSMDTTRQTQFPLTYSKMITEQLGIQLSDGLERDDRLDTSSTSGAQNFSALLQYEAYRSPRLSPHEFVMSVQLEQNFGGTGDPNLKGYQRSFTQPGITFAKGFGDLAISYLQPLAITGFTGYQFGEGGASGSTKGNQVTAGFSVQYSILYLVSKVARVDLPGWLSRMTPMIEMLYIRPRATVMRQRPLNSPLGSATPHRIAAWSSRSRPRYQPTRPPAMVGGRLPRWSCCLITWRRTVPLVVLYSVAPERSRPRCRSLTRFRHGQH